MHDRLHNSEPPAAAAAAAEPPAGGLAASADGPPDEIEPGTALKEEVDRFAHHPRAEASRIHRVEEEGESGATPYLYILSGLKIILPVAALMLTVALLAYYLL